MVDFARSSGHHNTTGTEGLLSRSVQECRSSTRLDCQDLPGQPCLSWAFRPNGSRRPCDCDHCSPVSHAQLIVTVVSPRVMLLIMTNISRVVYSLLVGCTTRLKRDYTYPNPKMVVVHCFSSHNMSFILLVQPWTEPRTFYLNNFEYCTSSLR